MLREVFEPNNEEVTGLRKLHNKALQSLYFLLSITRVTKIKYFEMTVRNKNYIYKEIKSR
jgi:hypothetical protein